MPTEMNLFGDKAAHSSSSVITLYHGSPIKSFTPTYGLGKDNHDYGRGFYLTPNVELAKEWAASTDQILTQDAWLHSYTLDLTQLTVVNFESRDAIYWLAELLKHRRPADLDDLALEDIKSFIKKFGVDTSKADVIRGWRADASYFQIAQRFIENKYGADRLSTLLRLGNLGVQYCVKSRKAFSLLHRVGPASRVDYKLYHKKYVTRDENARKNMYTALRTNRGDMTKTFWGCLR